MGGELCLFSAVFDWSACVCVLECGWVCSFCFDRSTGKNKQWGSNTARDGIFAFVMFLPYVFVPAGRSCFQPSRTHRANTVVHSVNLQMQVFKKKKKNLCVWVHLVTFMWEFICMCLNHKRAVEFYISVTTWQQLVLAGHNWRQISFYKCALPSALFSTYYFCFNTKKITGISIFRFLVGLFVIVKTK